MAERSLASTGVVFAALVSAIAGGIAAFFSWQAQIQVQREQNQNELLLALVSDDPTTTTENFLRFSELGLLQLSDETRAKLRDNPYLAPVSGGAESMAEAAPEAGAPIAPAAAAVAEIPMSQLVSDLNSPNAAARQEAGRLLTTVHQGSPEAIDLLIAELEAGRLENLTADGRFTVIAVLSSMEGWTSEQRRRADAAIRNIETRQQDGIAVGPRTSQQLERLQRRARGPS